MRKRLLTLILAITLMLTSVTAFAWENVVEDSFDHARELMKVLEVIDTTEGGNYKEDDILNRAELADIILKFGGYNSSAFTTVFADVNEDTPYATSITTLAELGIVARDMYYNPDVNATYEQALKMVTYLLGYKIMITNEGGWTQGVMRIANELGLTDGIVAIPGKELDARLLTVILYNALDSEYAPYMLVDNTKLETGDTLLSKRFDINKTKGVVKGNNITTLTSPVGTNGKVTIGSNIYYDAENIAGNYLGMEVFAYYTKEEGKILYAYPTKRNSSMTVLARDILPNYSRFSYTSFWYLEEGRTKEVKINAEADVIYNGKAFPSFTLDDLKIESGSITFIDNDGDREADVLFVNETQNYVVENVDTNENIIYDLYGNAPLELKDTEFLEVYSISGEKTEIGLLGKTGVLSVIISKDGKYAKITAYDDPVTGEVEKIETDEGDTLVTIDGETFVVAKNYIDAIARGDSDAKNIKHGAYGVFYLDAEEKIAAFVEDVTTAWQYGYLVKASYNDDTESVNARIIYDETGVKKVLFESKVRMDGTKKENEEVYDYLCLDDNGLATAAPVKRLIKFKMSGEGKVNAVDTVIQGSREDSNNLKMDASGVDHFWSIRTGRIGTGHNLGVLMDYKNTKIFRIPAPDSPYVDEVERYQMGTKTTANNRLITYYAYDVDFGGNVGALVEIDDGAEAALAPSAQGNNIIIVTDLKQVLNEDDEVVYRVTGDAYASGTITLDIEPETNITGVSKGDIIVFRKNYRDNIDKVRIMYDHETAGDYNVTEKIYNSDGDYDTRYVANAQTYIAKTVIADKQGSYIRVPLPGTDITTLDPTTLDITNSQTYAAGGAGVYYIEKYLKKVSKISLTDLERYVYSRNADVRVVILTTYSDLRQIYVYED